MNLLQETTVRNAPFAIAAYRFSETFQAWKKAHIAACEAITRHNSWGFAVDSVEREELVLAIHSAQRLEEKAWVAMRAESDRLHRVRTSE